VNAGASCWICVGLVLALGCRQSTGDRPVPPASKNSSFARVAAQPVAVSPSADSSERKTESVGAALKAGAAAAAVSETAKAQDDLQSEDREVNPLSETVTLTLSISPPVKALVMWGSKQVARVSPDNPTVELQRPRNMGPLDLDIRAEGFLPHHTRLYTDRNDKVNVRLVRPADATGLLGYRSSVAATAAKAKTK